MESKIAATERLRSDGRWGEASAFKDAELKRLRGEGMKGDAARDKAWQLMIEKFPPGDGDTTPSDSGPDQIELIDAGVIHDGQPADLVSDTLWVYDNFENVRANPENAPSLGAWGLLLWARKYRNRFFEFILPKAMAARDGNSEERERQRLGEQHDMEQIEMMEGLIKQHEDAHDEELRADMVGTVKRKAYGLIRSRAKRFGLTISSEAIVGFGAQTLELVKECLKSDVKSQEESCQQIRFHNEREKNTSSRRSRH